MSINLSIWEAQYHITETSHLTRQPYWKSSECLQQTPTCHAPQIHQDAHENCYLPSSSAIDSLVWLRKSNTTVQEEKRLSAFHTRCLRRIPVVSWQDHVPNEVIFERTSQVPLINILRHKRLTWPGHVTRMHQTRLPRRLLHWEPRGRRRPGRKRMRRKNTVSRDLQDSEFSFQEATVVAQDRKEWRSFVLGLCGLGPRQSNVIM